MPITKCNKQTNLKEDKKKLGWLTFWNISWFKITNFYIILTQYNDVYFVLPMWVAIWMYYLASWVFSLEHVCFKLKIRWLFSATQIEQCFPFTDQHVLYRLGDDIIINIFITSHIQRFISNKFCTSCLRNYHDQTV
jgi:hypothetical protein